MPLAFTHWIRRGAAALSFVAVVPIGHAAVIDQSNLITSGLHQAGGLTVTLDPSTGATGSLMQSFTPTFDRLDWASAGLSAASDLEFVARIWSTGTTPALLATSTKTAAATNTFSVCDAMFENCDLRMTEFVFDTALVLSPGEVYRLELMQLSDFTAGRGGWNYTQNGYPMFSSTVSPWPGYAGGALIDNGVASTWADLIFATGLRAAPEQPPPHNVPEAPTAALAALALLAAAGARRRRRDTA